MRRHVGEDKLGYLMAIEELLDAALTDEAWNSLANLRKVELAAVETYLTLALNARDARRGGES